MSTRTPISEGPLRIRGGSVFIALQAGLLIALAGVVFRAGALQHQMEANTEAIRTNATDIREINAALRTLGSIAAANAEGNLADRQALIDIRERLRALESNP